MFYWLYCQTRIMFFYRLARKPRPLAWPVNTTPAEYADDKIGTPLTTRHVFE
jgi:hypothetical protein